MSRRFWASHRFGIQALRQISCCLGECGGQFGGVPVIYEVTDAGGLTEGFDGAAVAVEVHARAWSLLEQVIDLAGILRQNAGGQGDDGVDVVIVGGMRPAMESCLTYHGAVGRQAQALGAGDDVAEVEIVSGGVEVVLAGPVDGGQERLTLFWRQGNRGVFER